MIKSQDTDFSYIKGHIVPKNQAVLSVEERGFRFGDGVFETIPVHNAVPYQWGLHINRLKQGLEALKIAAEVSGVQAICKVLIRKNDLKEGFLRLSISRGIGSHGYLPAGNGEPTVVVEIMRVHEGSREPVDLWVSSYEKISPKALPVSVKLMQGVSSTLVRLEAKENKCFEGLLLTEEGYIAEGSSSNIFWFKQGKLYTPALNLGVLAGTIRDAIIRISPYPVEEGKYTLSDVEKAEEVFITNAAWKVKTVTRLNPQGLTWDKRKVADALFDAIREDMESYSKMHQQEWQ